MSRLTVLLRQDLKFHILSLQENQKSQQRTVAVTRVTRTSLVLLTMSSSGNAARKKRRPNEAAEAQIEERVISKEAPIVLESEQSSLLTQASPQQENDTHNYENVASAAQPYDHDASSLPTTLYIGGLHPRVQQPHLEKMLQKYGTIERLDFLHARGICFCQYSHSSQAQAAISSLHGITLLGRTLKVQFAKQSRKNKDFCMLTRPNASHKETASLDSRIQALKRKLKEKEKG